MATLKQTDQADSASQFQRIVPQNNSFYPIPRSGHCILATTNYIYVIGGFNSEVRVAYQPRIFDREWSLENPILREIWRFSKLTKTWSYLNATGNGPDELTSHAAVFKNRHTIVIYGGSGFPFERKSSNKIYELSLKTMHWSQVVPTNADDDDHIPEPMYGQMTVMDAEGKNLYMSGGTNGLLYNLDVYRFNFEERKWTLLAVAPIEENRYRHTLALWDEKLFIIAGANADMTMSMSTILIFDLKVNSWLTMDTSPFIDTQGNGHFPEGRFGHCSAKLGDTVYMTGGKTYTGNLADFWSLHLPSLKWTKHGFNLPNPLNFHAMAITEEGELTIFGGIYYMYGGSEAARTNALYRTWLKVPSLATMAKEATVKAIQKTLNQHPGRNGYVQHVTPRLIADYIDAKPIQGIRANPKKLDLPDN